MEFNFSKITFTLICISILISCGTKKISNSSPKHTDMFLSQGNKEILINDGQMIDLNKDEFEIRFFNKKYESNTKKGYAALIAFSFDKEDFNNYKIGDPIIGNPYFEPGTGMAPNKSGFYESIFIKKNAACYLFYDNENDRRVDLIKDLNNGFLKLNFPVKRFIYKDKDKEIKMCEFNQINVAILLDWNLNKVIDNNELKRFTINFK